LTDGEQIYLFIAGSAGLLFALGIRNTPQYLSHRSTLIKSAETKHQNKERQLLSQKRSMKEVR